MTTAENCAGTILAADGKLTDSVCNGADGCTRILASLERCLPDAISLRRALHENPELSAQEYATTGRIREFLSVPGVEIEDFGLETGLCVLVRGEKPGDNTLLRADIDALPMREINSLPFAAKGEIAHTCGHDLHAAVLALCARIVAENRDLLCGDVRFLFQSAEETLQGAKLALAAGVLEREPKPVRAISMHCYSGWDSGSIGVCPGVAAASCDHAEITVTGKGGHTAAPHKCIDSIVPACDITLHLHTMMSQERAPLLPAALSVSSIRSGPAVGIAEETSLTASLRCYDEKQRQAFKEAISRIAICTAESYRASARVDWSKSCPVERNDPQLSETLLDAAKAALGEANAAVYPDPVAGSEDFAYFAERVPAVQFRLGTGTDDPATRMGCHSPRVVFDEKAIETGARVLTYFLLQA